MTTPPPLAVIDDDPDVRAYLELALAPLGHPVWTGVELPDERPVVALVDLLLGDRSGLPLVQALCAQGVPVLAISGLSLEAGPVQAARAAGARILGKPFGLQEVREAVRALLAVAGAQRA